MPVKSVRISSKSNTVIPDGTGARVRIMFTDLNRTDMKADLTDAEAAKLAREWRAEEVEPRPERRRAGSNR